MSDVAPTPMKGHRWFAACYARMAKGMERGPVGRLRAELLAGLTGDIVEIGAGTGMNFRHYSPDARVTALEPDPYMLRRARAAAADLPNVTVQQAPAEHLPVADASCDAVVSTLVLCTVGDVRAALAEVRRVLRPGGQLVLLEHVRSRGMFGRLQHAVQPAYGWFSGGCQWDRHTLSSLRAAGFETGALRRVSLSGLTAFAGVAPLAPAPPA